MFKVQPRIEQIQILKPNEKAIVEMLYALKEMYNRGSSQHEVDKALNEATIALCEAIKTYSLTTMIAPRQPGGDE